MKQLAAEGEAWRARGLDVLALNVDSLQPGSTRTPAQIATALERLSWPYDCGLATPEIVESFSHAMQSFVLKQESLRLPTSFLLDSRGQLAIIYKGPIESTQLAQDLPILNLSPQGIFQAACPFPGRWKPEIPLMASPRRMRR